MKNRSEKEKLPIVVMESTMNSSMIEELRSHAQVLIIDPYADEDVWIEAARKAVAIINRKARLSEKVLRSATNLKLVARTGIGVDNTRIHLKTAVDMGLTVTYNPGINSNSVAELTLLLVLGLYRRLLELDRSVRAGEWNRGQTNIGNKLEGKVWGVIGFGQVGKQVSRIATSLGTEVLAFDPYVQQSVMAEYGATQKDLASLLRESDVVSIHAPLVEKTRHMLGAPQLGIMKNDSVLINVSRGGLVDETALYQALKDRRISGAGLDTLEEEPAAMDNPILTLKNVILTPHIGGSTVEDIEAGTSKAIQEVIRFLQGKKLTSIFEIKEV